ncbi:unnamed protein product [Phaedon cochleariae]|uniref:Chitin-binding type-4 domain-containing protein n=1 Tax=Phaedon cochleariae TaxID=80249 RepID=A0A9P0GQY5_PHACE|nr:unnamed protein product [Phaedon cochleariae]
MMSKLCFVLLSMFVSNIAGHGMMLDPPNRSSLWRFNSSAPSNFNDNQNWCGGNWVQNGINGGKCGVCGDSYTDPHPQDNENTGKYGVGIIAGTYEAGSVVEVLIHLTANHLGEFTYSLCELEDPNAPESGEECFQPLKFEDGSERFIVEADDEIVRNRIQLPNSTCERCVLRWTYKCGNSWGVCDDQVWRPGCGPQEHFRSCSDIVIA